MKFAISNIALSPFDHGHELHKLRELGFIGLEVAPSRAWRDTWKGLTASAVMCYRRQVEAEGLSVVGLHSLMYDHPELGLFRDRESDERKLDFLVHLSAVCRDLGGRTLIYGGGRARGNVPLAEAYERAIAFCCELCHRIEGHGTIYCFEPLGPDKMDFINSVFESLQIVEAVASPAFQVQLDAEALATNGEIDERTFAAAAPHLVHVHANDVGLGILGSSGKIDHKAIGEHLRKIGYDGFVSIEQRMLNANDPLMDVKRSAEVLRACYG
jgi:sugar phosphate isomerase/epimerase